MLKNAPEGSWVNSKLVEVDPIDEVRRLKRKNGSDMIIFGSGTIKQLLTAEELIDDYFILVTPVILGAGKTMFVSNQRLSLKLLEVRSFESGNVIMYYRTDR
jgi:dihydrofolate reductase